MSSMDALYKALGRRVPFPEDFGSYHVCPFHTSVPGTLKIFPEVGLFRCHRCAHCFNAVELLLSDPKSQTHRERVELAARHGIIRPKQIESVISKLEWRDAFNSILESGRAVFNYWEIRRSRRRKFGDIATICNCDIVRLNLDPKGLRGPSQEYQVRTIRNVYGRIVQVELWWDAFRKHITSDLERWPSRTFSSLGWNDTRKLDDVFVCSHESIALNLNNGMSKWHNPKPILLIDKRGGPLTAATPPFSKVCFVTSESNGADDAFIFQMAKQVDVKVKVLSGDWDDWLHQTEDEGSFTDRYLHSCEDLLMGEIQGRTLQEVSKRVSPLLNKKAIDPSIRKDILNLAAEACGSSSAEILENINRFPAVLVAEVDSFSYCCRNKVYYRKKPKRKEQKASNFSVQITERQVNETGVHWTLLLTVEGKTTLLQMEDSQFEDPTCLWQALNRAAAESKMGIPTFFFGRHKNYLPQIIKLSSPL